MVRLTTLGTTDLRLDGGVPVDAILRQPRRLALLVYLALEGRRGFVRRDRVLGVFWPDSTDARARSSLSQALHSFRTHLGPDTIEVRGQEELRLAASRVETDACLLLDAAGGGEPEGALRLATGEFLPSFFSGGIRDVDDWIEGVRADVRRVVAEAGWAAAEKAAQRGEPVAGGAYARQAAAACPDDEAAIRRLMEFQVRIGDRAGALQAYDALARRLEHEYETEPDGATRRLAEKIRQGITTPPQPAVAASIVPEPSMAPSATPPESPSPPGEEADVETGPTAGNRHQGRLFRALVSIVVVALLTPALVTLWGLGRNNPPRPKFDRARLLVEGTAGELGAALSATVIGQLQRAERIEVLAPGSELRAARGIPQFALRMTVVLDDTVLQTHALLVDPERQLVVATTSVTEATRSRATALDRTSARVAAFARQAIGTELDRRRAELEGLGPRVLTTWLEVQRGIAAADSLMNRGLHEVARVRLASADSTMARLERAAPSKAVFPRERAALANRLFATYRFQASPDLARARAALLQGIHHSTRALQINSRDGRAREWRGALRYWWWLTTPPDSDRVSESTLSGARTDLAQAAEEMPSASRAWALLSSIYQQFGDFERAYLAARHALAADAFLQQTNSLRVRLFTTAMEANDLPDAEHWCQLIARDQPREAPSFHCRIVLLARSETRGPAVLERAEILRDQALEAALPEGARFQVNAAYGVILIKADRADDARKLARTLAAQPSDEALPEAAWVYHALGDTLEARSLLERFVAARPVRRSWILSSPRFVDVRTALDGARGP